eukprot:8203893-Pyramimonas_sp.AAC.1
MWLSPWRRADSSTFATVSRMEGGSFPKCGSRRSAAHIRLKHVQGFYEWRAAPFQNMALGLALR